MEKKIDIHAHILPGVDDGSESWEESLAMARLAYEQGFRCIIATPHHSRRRGTEGLRELAAQLQRQVEEILPDMTILLGEELFYYEGLAADLRAGKALTLASSRYALVEFDVEAPFQSIYQAVRKLSLARFIPVIAHVERYFCLREQENLGELMKCDCRLQMNYDSLQGSFLLDRDVRWCRRQVEEGRIHFLGTDMHGIHHRKPDISGSMVWLKKHMKKMDRYLLTFGSAEQSYRAQVPDRAW